MKNGESKEEISNAETLKYLMRHSGISIPINTYNHLEVDNLKDEMIRLKELV